MGGGLVLLFVETTAVDALSAEVGIISMQTCVERQCKNTAPIAAQRWTEVTTMAEYHGGGQIDTIEILADALGLSIDEYVGHKVVTKHG